MDFQTLLRVVHDLIKLIWTFYTQGWWGHKNIVLSAIASICTPCILHTFYIIGGVETSTLHAGIELV